jgi:hypothetical protein
METTLHRQLKELYAIDPLRREVAVAGYRIDAVADGRLVEIQYGSLGAIRAKVRKLLASHDVLVVKPLAASKRLVTQARRNAQPVIRRSPRHETVYDVFLDLVHFVDVFPHPRLTLHVLLTEQEEHRRPVAKRRWKSKGYRVASRRLVGVVERHVFRTADDLAGLLPRTLPAAFSTADISRGLGIPRWVAQKMAYCLRETDAVRHVGKSGNAWLYERSAPARAA